VYSWVDHLLIHLAAVMPLPREKRKKFAGVLAAGIQYMYEMDIGISTDADFVITEEVDPGNKTQRPRR